MKAHIEVTMDNAAFDEPAFELARILRELANSIERNGIGCDKRLMDVNGNRVGKFVVTGERPD
jgi:hypothetical protein